MVVELRLRGRTVAREWSGGRRVRAPRRRVAVNKMPRPALLPLIVAAIAAPIVVAVYVGGVALGIGVAVVVLLVIVFVVVRARPRRPIEVAADGRERRRLLLAVSRPVDEEGAAREVKRAARGDGTAARTEILALAPTQPSFLDRWASDLRASRGEAERKLQLTVAALSRKDLEARGEIGESDLLLAVEDTLRDFPADEVILVTGPEGDDDQGVAAADQLRQRLPVPFEHLVVGRG